jgi:hypothetical protein
MNSRSGKLISVAIIVGLIITIVLFLPMVSSAITSAIVLKEDPKKTKTYKKIEFSNGYKMVCNSCESINGTLEDPLKIFTPSGSKFFELSDDIVKIKDVSPDEKKAKAALVTTNCSGSICTWTNYYFILENEKKIDVHKFSPQDSPDFSISITFDKKNRATVLTNNLFMYGGENEYGDKFKFKVKFINDVGFVHEKFNDKFTDILSNSESFFAKNEFRDQIFNKLGSDSFKSLRYIIGSRGEGKFAEVEQYRYILLNNVEPHNAMSGYAAVVIDGITGETYAVIIDLNREYFKIASTGKWSQAIFNILIGNFFSNDEKTGSKQFINKKIKLKSRMEEQINIKSAK